MIASPMTVEGPAGGRPGSQVNPEVAAAEIVRRRAGRHLLLLFDFDGTLAPFAPNPDAVCLPPGVASSLSALAATPATTVGVISGRRLADLGARVVLSAEGYLAGFHGLEIQAPGETFLHPEAAAARATVRSLPMSWSWLWRIVRASLSRTRYSRSPCTSARLRQRPEGPRSRFS